MRQFKILGTALAAALLVAACGGGGDGNQAPAVSYSAVVSFGDSLSDAGTYGPGLVAATRIASSSGGGMFNINGIGGAVGANPTPSYNWAQLVSAQATGKVNCAARAGGFGMVEVKVAGCTNYAQGGSRVASGVGNGNTTAGAAAVAAGTATTGPLTEAVTTQIANYALDSGSATFTGKELITVLAGANDLFAQTTSLKTAVPTYLMTTAIPALVTALMGSAPTDATTQARLYTALSTAAGTAAVASGATPTSIITAVVTAAAVDAATYRYANSALATGPTAAGNAVKAFTLSTATSGMAAAATTLATAIKGMRTNGAQHIVVVNIPDVSQTPYAMGTIVYTDATKTVIADNSTQQLVLAMTMAFNQTLATQLGVGPDSVSNGILLVDAFSENQRQIASPAHYALSNVKDVACNPALTPVNPVDATTASSLVCTTSTLVTTDSAGNAVSQDQALHFLFADSVHPTPYGYKLLAQYVIQKMVFAGWI
jgi:phospholipase/lecithinase/hemolysin